MNHEEDGLLSKALSILKEEGLTALIKTSFLFTYDLMRRSVDEKYIPKRKKVCYNNGIETPIKYFPLDLIAPGYTPVRHQNPRDNPTYENFLVESLKEHCSRGDDVVVIGGGLGITAVIAAETVGGSGSVQVYEASEGAYNQVRATASFNNVDDVVDCHHTIVNHAISLMGDPGNAKTLAPSELPDADVYELDCEGAELDILKGMTANPNTVIVETHAKFGASKADTRKLLESLGYEILDSSETSGGVSHIVAKLS